MTTSRHPFDPLTPEEIQLAADVLKCHHIGAHIIFRVITLSEPPKAAMIPFLEKEHGEEKGTAKVPARLAMVQAHVNQAFFEYRIDLEAQDVVSEEALQGRHSHVDRDYMEKVEMACMDDPQVQAELYDLKLPKEAKVVVEAWTYGTDGLNDMSKRMTMCWFYMHLSSDSDANHYAYPLDIVAEMSDDLKVVNVFLLPSMVKEQCIAVGRIKEFDRRKIHQGSEYYPTLNTQQRTSTKPYHVSQPEGPSFSIDGNKISWEKWTMRVGFNYREGMTLHDIRYDGRSLFYRLSLTEMFVPYGDPRMPYPRKAAFDLGNDGAGLCANNLKLGCDCLGHIQFFDSWLTTRSGRPLKMPNVICCHEVDDGILWKHTNTWTGNGAVTRSRLLVLQTIITVSNYEYIFLFYFGQDASIHYEVRATGILSTAFIDIEDKVPWGTVVAPGVMAPSHQHLFCLRIDPAIDGHANSLVVEETRPLPVPFYNEKLDPRKLDNSFGVGFTTTSGYIPHERGLDLDHTLNRVFKIVNEHNNHPFTGTPVGFKLVPCYTQLLLAHPDSFHSKRAEFAAHAVWVTRHSDNEMFPAGKFTNQSMGGEGIASWIESRRGKRDREGRVKSAVRDTDIVVWHTFGATHIPRAEDWPVMPAEKMVVGLKPVNFFLRNPALDVQISTQERNRSVLIGDGQVPGGAGEMKREGDEGMKGMKGMKG
ncbi:hypothetical protein N0V88_003411 [Collariella sp. IMI 366227]|nr:hypothetical protein N0V88_003411 [Collariella sp. IMI 366227]